MSADDFWRGAIIGGLAFFFLSGEKNVAENTFYFATCSDNKHSIYDCPEHVLASSITYKTLIKEQLVLYKGDYWPDKKRCQVFDEENWICDHGNWTERVINDEYRSTPAEYVTAGKYAANPPSMPLTEQVNFFLYWFYRI